MARCPRCCTSFRTLEDEEGMHECPRCGLGPNEIRCRDCRRWGPADDLGPDDCCPDCTEYHRCDECGAWMIDRCPDQDCPRHTEEPTS